MLSQTDDLWPALATLTEPGLSMPGHPSSQSQETSDSSTLTFTALSAALQVHSSLINSKGCNFVLLSGKHMF